MAARGTTTKIKRRRKHDRKRVRSASHARYNAEKRWITNKARRVRKNNSEADYLAYCKKHDIRVRNV